jgi:hypothetical protein
MRRSLSRPARCWPRFNLPSGGCFDTVAVERIRGLTVAMSHLRCENEGNSVNCLAFTAVFSEHHQTTLLRVTHLCNVRHALFAT